MYISNAQILSVVLGKKIGVKWKSQVSSLKTKPKKNSNGCSKIDKSGKSGKNIPPLKKLHQFIFSE